MGQNWLRLFTICCITCNLIGGKITIERNPSTQVLIGRRKVLRIREYWPDQAKKKKKSTSRLGHADSVFPRVGPKVHDLFTSQQVYLSSLPNKVRLKSLAQVRLKTLCIERTNSHSHMINKLRNIIVHNRGPGE